jgi:hypothetical protein
VRVFCANCSAEFEVSYWRSGSAYPCPVCSRATPIDPDHVRAYAPSGYEVTFRDFVRLVTDHEYRGTILPLLREWFGLEIVSSGPGGEVRFRDAEGDVHGAFDVHARIQNDAARQRELYNNAMTLWR